MTTQDNEKVRIAPVEIDVPGEDPFQFDELDRKSSVETLTSIVDVATTPCVIAVDGEWGSGKTTFLKMCCEHMRARDYHVAWFNAWETDFANSPFQALSAELTHSLAESGYGTSRLMASMLKRAATSVGIGLAKTGAGMLLPGTATMIDAGAQAIESWRSGDPISEYLELKKSIHQFQDALGKIAANVSEQTQGKPLIVAIDELDRCRPSYAIELLEVAKHIFMTENVVFILGVNTAELANSVKSLYGSDFNATGYLRRFFSLSIRLPNNNRQQFAESITNATGWHERISSAAGDPRIPQDLMRGFINKISERSVRDAEQATYHLGLVSRLVGNMGPQWATALVTVLILRISDHEAYRKILGGDLSDSEIVAAVLGQLPMESHDLIEQRNLANLKALIEMTVIAASAPRTTDPSIKTFWREQQKEDFNRNSLALSQHSKKLEAHDSGVVQMAQEEYRYSQSVLDRTFNFWLMFVSGDPRPALVRAAEMLELLST